LIAYHLQFELLAKAFYDSTINAEYAAILGISPSSEGPHATLTHVHAGFLFSAVGGVGEHCAGPLRTASGNKIKMERDSLARHRPQALLVAVLVTALLLCITIQIVSFSSATHVCPDWKIVSANAKSSPITFETVTRTSIRMSSDDERWLHTLLRPKSYDGLDVSMMLHLMHFHGKDFGLSRRDVKLRDSNSMLEVLTNEQRAQQIFGAPPMIRTDFGVRYLPIRPSDRLLSDSQSGESHRDQFLASMADLGVSLDQTIVMQHGTFSLRDVLSDSLAQFHLDQDELQWSAFAYAAYLPPQARWLNRYGEEYTFEDIARRLLSAPLSGSSCCGTHILFALTEVFQADSNYHFLSSEVRSRIDERLQLWLKAAIADQLSDGSWMATWWQPISSKDSESKGNFSSAAGSRLLPTSHLAEWLFMLPQNFDVPPSTSRNATAFLLDRVRIATEEDMWNQVCPYTHSCHVLALFNSLREEEELPAEP
jgi:hypothetical protein